MKMKIRCGLLAILLLIGVEMANAGNGIKRSEWGFRPEITFDNAFLGIGGSVGLMFLEEAIYGDEESPWWFPLITHRSSAPVGIGLEENYSYYHKSESPRSGVNYNYHESKLRYENNILKDLFGISSLGFSFGGCVTYMSKELPLGFWAKVAYERQVASLKNENNGTTGFWEGEMWIYNSSSKNRYTSQIGEEIGDKTTLVKQMIVPELGIKIRLGNYRTATQNFTLDLGARYDYAIDSKGLFSGKDAVNNGVTGIVGLIWGQPAKHIQVGFYVNISFYDYFNKDYSPDGITYPFKNLTNHRGFSGGLTLRRGF